MANSVSLMFVRADNESKTTTVNAMLSDPMDFTIAKAAKSLGYRTTERVGLSALNGGPIPFDGKSVGDIIEKYGTTFRIASADLLG